MPAMSLIEQAFCRSRPWRAFTRRVVFPWAFGANQLEGDVLELGSGSGANAAELLARYPCIRVTATDVDPAMLASARRCLRSFGDRADDREADATALPFPDAAFDAVVSLIMLHHVIGWERALAESVRVLRPGGLVAGYDLVQSLPARALHRIDRSPHRLAELALVDIGMESRLGGLVDRFLGPTTTASCGWTHGDKPRPLTTPLSTAEAVPGRSTGRNGSRRSGEAPAGPARPDQRPPMMTATMAITMGMQHSSIAQPPRHQRGRSPRSRAHHFGTPSSSRRPREASTDSAGMARSEEPIDGRSIVDHR